MGEKALKGKKNCMKVSKVEEINFRYTGPDVERHLDGITVSMDYYVDSLAEFKDIRKGSGTENLKKLELKQYRKRVGKFNWLAQSPRQHLCYTSLRMAKKDDKAKISDLKTLNLY